MTRALVRAIAWMLLPGCAVLAATARSAEDPGAKALQQHQLQRQQQQDAHQLRMQQQYRALQSPAVSGQREPSLEQLQIEQRQRQQADHYRQSIDPTTAQPSDDAGARRAKDAMKQLDIREQNQRELRRFDQQQQQAGGERDGPEARVPVPTEKLKVPPSGGKPGREACAPATACP